MNRMRLFAKAKQHYFMDASMSEVVDPVSDEQIATGAGTKVAITVGPACQSVEILSDLLRAGVDCARLDLTWGSLEFHRTSLKNLAAAMKATKRLCSVWVDTVGREILVRMPATSDSNGWLVLEKTPLDFEAGQKVVITTDASVKPSSSVLPVNIASFPSLVNPGQELHVSRFLATGAEGRSLHLQIESTTDTEIHCIARNNASLVGLLTVLVSHRECELNTHDHDLNRELPLMNEHDVECVKTLGSEYELDFVSLSYCNSCDDVWAAREALDAFGLTQTKLIAKVERKAAVHNFENIINAADAVLFSRGNLGLDFEPEEMALLQKRCIARCNMLGKPILMTRFIDTMVNTPRPTRAEATDVANAVLDGVDGILLGAETVRGLYPLAAVQTVIKLCRAAEKYFDYRTHHEEMMGEAYEEEISLASRHTSAEDFSMVSNGKPLSMTPRLIKPTANGSSSLSNISTSSIGNLKTASQQDEELRKALGSPGGMAATSANTSASDLRMLTEDRKVSSFGVLPVSMDGPDHLCKAKENGAPYMSKVESIASSAVRTAEKINAGLLVVLAQTGRTVSLVAKYRPPMPVMAVIVPSLKSTNLGWQLEGKFLARQCLMLRGVSPLMAAPMSESSEGLLGDAVEAAHKQKLVKPHDYVVCILSQQGSLVVKVVQVNAAGTGIASLLPPSYPQVTPDETTPRVGDGVRQYQRQTSISLAGAGTLGAGRSQVMAPVGMVRTLTEDRDAVIHFSAATGQKK